MMTARPPTSAVRPAVASAPGASSPGGTVVPLHRPAGPSAANGAPGPALGPPPHSLLAERVVLSEAINEPTSLAQTSWLKPEAFFLPINAAVWEAILALHAAGSPGDLGDLLLWLQTHKRLSGREVTLHLGGLVNSEAYTNDVAAHADRVHQLWRLRELIRAASAVALEGHHRADDPDGAIRDAEAALHAVAETAREKAQGSSLAEAARVHIEQLRALAEGRDPSGGRISTGYQGLDRTTSGFGRGELWVLGGLTGFGKTALSLCLASNVAFGQDLGVAVFSFEMQVGELAARLLSVESGVSATAMKEGRLSDMDLHALDETEHRFQRLAVHLDDNADLTVFDISARAQAQAEQMKARGKRLGLVVVDYLQIVRERGMKGRTREQEVAEISGELKRLAKRLDCTVLALSQLSGEFEKEGRAPRNADLRESKKIGHDADLVGILWRSKECPRGAVQLRITKQRKGPAHVDVLFGWQPELTRFCDFEHSYGEAPRG